MARPTAGIHPRKFDKKLRQHGYQPVRNGRGSHTIYRDALGHQVVIRNPASNIEPPFSAISSVAKHLGISIKDLLA